MSQEVPSDFSCLLVLNSTTESIREEWEWDSLIWVSRRQRPPLMLATGPTAWGFSLAAGAHCVVLAPSAPLSPTPILLVDTLNHISEIEPTPESVASHVTLSVFSKLRCVAGAGPDGWGFLPQTPTAARGPLREACACREAHCLASEQECRLVVSPVEERRFLMSHVNILNYHPQLAPDIFKILSNVLTSAEQKIVVLECKLQNQCLVELGFAPCALPRFVPGPFFGSARRSEPLSRSLLLPASPARGVVSPASSSHPAAAAARRAAERAEPKALPPHTLESSALEETKIQLRRKEMAVEAFREGVEEKIQIFRETTEAAAKVHALQTQLNGRDSELEMLRNVNGCLREDNARLRKRLTGDNDLTGRTRLHAGEFKSDGSNGVASLDFETDEMDIERFSAAPPVDQHPVRTTSPSTDAIWPPSLNDNHHTEQRSQISDEYAQEWSSQLFDAEKPSMESSDAPASTSRKKTRRGKCVGRHVHELERIREARRVEAAAAQMEPAGEALGNPLEMVVECDELSDWSQ
ncbi:hypothetical protein B0H11DRAFT_1909166 [Mycena galericulata]|nr:hypothetical protein B0H11DRAFT_1909166 [Mycena galericulata]